METEKIIQELQFAETLKVMGYVNKFNCGISKIKTEMQRNGNPPPVFDVNKQTEFRVTVLPNTTVLLQEENGNINDIANIDSCNDIEKNDNINYNINNTTNTCGCNDIAKNDNIKNTVNIDSCNNIAKNDNINCNINSESGKNDEINCNINDVVNICGCNDIAKNDKINCNINDAVNIDSCNDIAKNDNIKSNLITELKKQDRESMLVNYIEKHPCCHRKELAKHIGVSLPTLDRILMEMTADSQKAKIEHRGSNKIGGWFIKT